jgi:hypothetical protein
MINKRGGQYSKNGQNRSTFDLANDGDLTLARKSVNGGTKGIQEVNNYYDIWKSIINNNLIKIVESSKNGKVFKALGYGIIVISIVGFAYGLYYFSRKK